MKTKIKAFIAGFDYGMKNYTRIEDHHFHSYPGAAWHDRDTNELYRKAIQYARKYMCYRYEILTITLLVLTSLIFMFTW